VIFVRNVPIHFDTDTTRDVPERVTCQLNSGGTVLLGIAENRLGIPAKVVRVSGSATSSYRRPGDVDAMLPAGKAAA